MLVVFGIVKNEEERLDDFLSSAFTVADEVYLHDTGSTDHTVNVAKGLGATVHRRPWIDFGANLTSAVNEAQKHMGLDRDDWLLRMDADMTIEELHPRFLEWLDNDATAQAYNVMLREAGSEWRLPLLMRAGQTWEYHEPTHEYLDTTNRQCLDVSGLVIRHHATGSNRARKQERDIELLAEGVRNNEARAVFYTADAYFCLGQYQEAYDLYSRRADMDDAWEEERWYAQYRAGYCMLLIDPYRGISELMDAWQARPQRSEPLMRIREWIDQTRERPIPPQDKLFIEKSAYIVQ
jgi:glycosyltransferase involved in cell wall biosynthesis